MMKRIMLVLLCLCMVFSLVACGGSTSTTKVETVPESVKALQHKIDKAMETPPTNERIEEIKKEYGDLLSSEQAMVKNYEKVIEMYTVDKHTLSCIVAVNEIQSTLSSTSSFRLVEAECSMLSDYSGVLKITYKVNGTENKYFRTFSMTSDIKTDRWTCKVKADSEQSAKDIFKGVALGMYKSVKVDTNQVMNNLNVSVAHGD